MRDYMASGFWPLARECRASPFFCHLGARADRTAVRDGPGVCRHILGRDPDVFALGRHTGRRRRVPTEDTSPLYSLRCDDVMADMA